MKTSRRWLLVGVTGALVAWAAGPVRAAESERPDIVIILADDMGYSDIGCYGGEIDTPNLNRLAANGLRFTQFYNTGRCCPTRASLLTGLHPHQTGIGHMTNPPERPNGFDTGLFGYRGFLNRHCVTIAEVLKQAGYHTLMAGKWHVGYFGKEKWPLARGFERYYGIISGGTNYFHPTPPRGLTLQDQPVEPEGPNYYITDAFTDYAIRFVREAAKDGRPFFLYLAYTSPHWPLQAPADVVAKYRGKYLIGWDRLRQQRYDRMIRMGLVDPKWELPPRDCRPWDSLSEQKKREMDFRMSIYAAQVDRMDWNIGRLLQTLRELGRLDNTLLLFLSDNGGCAEGGELGGGSPKDLGTDRGWVLSYGRCWAQVSNTPFRRYKHFVHEGGISTPLIVHWPRRIKDPGSFRRQPGYLPDIMATCVDVSGAEYPKTFHGNSIPPMEGKSLLPAILDNRPIQREAMFWEHEGNRAIRIGNWKLVARGRKGKWELYNLADDRSEMHDLAAKYPERVKEMSEKWLAWAKRCHVLPYPRPKKRPGKKPQRQQKAEPKKS